MTLLSTGVYYLITKHRLIVCSDNYVAALITLATLAALTALITLAMLVILAALATLALVVL